MTRPDLIRSWATDIAGCMDPDYVWHDLAQVWQTPDAGEPAVATWGESLGNAKVRPGLVIIPAEDSYTGGETMARRSAERAGAEVAVLQGLGHWWMCEDPVRGAAALNGFFASLQ